MPEVSTPDSTERPPDRRKLVAVLYADMVGYSRLIGLDDAGTLQRLRGLRKEVIDPAIREHRGHIVQTGGDFLLIVFDSIDGAVRCAVRVQQQVPILDHEQPSDRAIRFRIGINIGDAIPDGTDLHGDAVNVAARLQAECPPGAICVSRSVRDHVHGRLDLVFEELGSLNLKNIARPVEVFLLKPNNYPAVRQLPIDREDSPLPNKPSIAVLPFRNMSSDSDQVYFADGMVEEIIAALSRIAGLFVISCNSDPAYRDQAVSMKQVGRELGTRYVLEGSVRKNGGRVRIAAQLVEVETGNHWWADRFEGPLEDVFALQDKVALSVAGAIEPTLQVAETARLANRSINDLSAYDAYLRAYAMAMFSGRQIPEALRLLEKAIEREPHYGPALAWAAHCCVRLVWDDRSEDADTDRRKGADYARRALEVAGNDPVILATVAQPLAYLGEDIDAMIALVDRALTLNPNYARGWHISGILKCWAGQLDIAIERVETSLRLSPRTRVGKAFATIGQAHFLGRHFDEAVTKLLVAVQEDPTFPHPYRTLAACYAHMGRLEEANAIIARLGAVSPVVIPTYLPLRNSEHLELVLSGLRLATGDCVHSAAS